MSNLVFGVDLSRKEIPSMLLELQKYHNLVPESKCLGCPSRGGEGNEVVADCCRKASPPLYYIEFLRVLQFIEGSWSKEARAKLLISCFETFLNPEEEKPCVLLDQETSACRVYRQRWTNCRTYGMISDEDWLKRARSVVAERLVQTGKFMKNTTQKVKVQKGNMVGLDGKPMYREIEVEQTIADVDAIMVYIDELFKDGFNPDAINAKLSEDYSINKAVYDQCKNVRVQNVSFALNDIDSKVRKLESELMGTNISKASENPTYLPFHTYFLLRSVGEKFVDLLLQGRFSWSTEAKADFVKEISKNVHKMIGD